MRPHTRLSSNIAVELVGEIKARLLQKKRKEKKMSYVNLHVGGCHLMIGLIDRPTWCRWQTSTYFQVHSTLQSPISLTVMYTDSLM